MKRTVFLGFILMVAVLAQAEHIQHNELNVTGDFLFPNQDSIWGKSAYGCSAKYILWKTNMISMAFSVGLQKWEADDEVSVTQNAFWLFHTRLEGDATLVPVSASCLSDIPLGKKSYLSFEGGLRYVVVNADIQQKRDSEIWWTGRQYPTSEVNLSVGNNILGFAEVDYNFAYRNNVKFVAGLGYQVDVVKGDVSGIGGSSTQIYHDENKLQSAFLRAGIIWDL